MTARYLCNLHKQTSPHLIFFPSFFLFINFNGVFSSVRLTFKKRIALEQREQRSFWSTAVSIWAMCVDILRRIINIICLIRQRRISGATLILAYIYIFIYITLWLAVWSIYLVNAERARTRSSMALFLPNIFRPIRCLWTHLFLSSLLFFRLCIAHLIWCSGMIFGWTPMCDISNSHLEPNEWRANILSERLLANEWA